MKTMHLLILIALVCGDLVVGAAASTILPNSVPVHWNIRGEVDRMGAPWELAFVFPATIAFLAGLLIVLPMIKPIGTNIARFQGIYGSLGITITIALILIHGAVVLNASGWPMRVDKVISLFTGVLIMILGNSMGKLRRNPIIGIRTPWTLADDTVWERTHRTGGQLMVLYGLAILLTAAMTTSLITTCVIIGGALILVIWSFAYSWRSYRQLHREQIHS